MDAACWEFPETGKKRKTKPKKRVINRIKLELSPQSRKGREEINFLFGGERPPNKKVSAFLLED
jgi:hypothetical protein